MRILPALAVPTALLLGSCDVLTEPEPEFGDLQVTTVTRGLDLDFDGYLVEIGGTAQHVLANGTVVLSGLNPGRHDVTLGGLAANCTQQDEARSTVEVLPKQAITLTLNITCVATTGVIGVAVVSTGLDLDSGYSVTAGSTSRQVTAGGLLNIDGLVGGAHTIELGGVASNCAVTGQNPQRAQLEVGGIRRDTARVTFAITCVATTGVIEVAVVTTGVDLDPNGYLLVGGSVGRGIPSNALTRIDGLPAGAHAVALAGVASNCTLTGPNPRPAELKVGSLTRDTARVGFGIACVRTDKIAAVQNNAIVVAYADGSNTVSIASGYAPAWSPNGDFIVFESVRCSPSASSAVDPPVLPYSYPPGWPPPLPCQAGGLDVIGPDGSSRRLTDNGLDRDPAWSPDGELIALGRGGELRLVNADGTSDVGLATPGMASEPAWAPGGTRIAFTCEVVTGNLDICVINRDGSGFRRLTTDPAEDTDAAWSPDGTRIAFTTNGSTGREGIALMSASGGSVVRVVGGSSPAWSRDGVRLVFVISGLGLASVNSDGTGFVLISSQGEDAPAWRP